MRRFGRFDRRPGGVFGVVAGGRPGGRSKALCIAFALVLPAVVTATGVPLAAAETAKTPKQAEAESIVVQAKPLVDSGKWDEAIAAADKALAADDTCGPAYFLRGCARQGKGQLDESPGRAAVSRRSSP